MMKHTSAAPRTGRRALAVLLAAALAAAAACGGDKSTGPRNSNPVGSYTLTQVDRASLPVEIYHGPYFDAANQRFYNQYIVTIDGGTVDLDADGSFSQLLKMTYDGDGEQSMGLSMGFGAYQVKGDKIRLVFDDDGSELNGTLRSGTLTIDLGDASPGSLQTYRR